MLVKQKYHLPLDMDKLVNFYLNLLVQSLQFHFYHMFDAMQQIFEVMF